MSELIRFDLTVPMVNEAELVAARAAEQIADNMEFDRKSIDQIKLALIEACINAFEHSGSDDSSVYLNLIQQEGRLMIVVLAFGKGCVPKRVTETLIALKLSTMGYRRGWGVRALRA